MKRNINILYDLQLSALDSLEDGRFLFTPDSNVNVATFTVNGLLEKNPNWHVYLLVPPKEKTAGGLIFPSELSDRVTKIEYDYFGNPFMDRMTFLPRSLPKNIDIVYTNDPCKVLAYKTYYYYALKKIIPVICRNHWVTGKTDRKVPEQIDFITRQVEGVIKGDWMTFNSLFAANIFLENASEFFSEETVSSLVDKMACFETVDVKKVDRHRTTKRLCDEFLILWAHRLSYYTGWEKTFVALLQVWEKRKDFRVLIPDPGNKFTQKELKERYPFMLEIDKKSWTHEKYLEACWASDIVLGNHQYPATWGGLAITEPMAACTVPIMPNRWAYNEMYWMNAKNIFFEDEKEMVELVEHYIDLPKEILDKKKERSRKFCLERLSMKKYISTIEDKINELA